jgi:calpain-15
VANTVSASDLEQGLLGDCYFLSALSALAEDPERIRNMFITKQTNYAGCYAISLYLNGEN